MKKKNELLIAIPTKDHPMYIMFYLAKTLDIAKKNNIDIMIFDASRSDDTFRIVMDRVKQGYDNLFIKRYDPDSLLETRCKDIYCRKDYRYIWLCGDGAVLNLQTLLPIVWNEIENNRDIICFSAWNRYNYEFKEYNDSSEFCRECFCHTTYFGAVVMKGGYVSGELFDYLIKRYAEHSVPAVYFELFKEGTISAVYYKTMFYTANYYKKASIATKQGRTIYAFAHLFSETIDKLPSYYDRIKKDLEKWQDGMYDWDHLWSMRCDGNLNIKVYLHERKYLIKASDKGDFTFLAVTLCPKKIAKALSLIGDKLW